MYRKHSDMLKIVARVKQRAKRKEYHEAEQKVIARYYID